VKAGVKPPDATGDESYQQVQRVYLWRRWVKRDFFGNGGEGFRTYCPNIAQTMPSVV
jgi:hypothetical protein